MPTDNHNYDTPTKGTTDYHVPLNSNFDAIDGDVAIRDLEANRTNYTPKDDQEYIATDTGAVYLGDGSTWTLHSRKLQSVDTEKASIGPDSRDWGDRIHVFSGAGQSNAVGQGTATNSPDLSKSVAMEYEPDTDSLTALKDPVGNATDGSAWPAFAERYHELTGVPVVIVTTAKGGSAQTQAADGGDGNWGPNGALRSRLVDEVNSTMSRLDADGYDAVYKGILWSQGEQDALTIKNDSTYTKSDYKAGLETMLDYYDSQFGTWQFNILETAYRDGNDNLAHLDVREAQREVCRARNYVHYGSGQQRSFITRNLLVDTVHYNQEGLNIMGKTAAERIVGGESDPSVLKFQTPVPEDVFSGRITHVGNNINVSGEGSAADTLTTIYGGGQGAETTLIAQNKLTIEHGTDNIILKGGGKAVLDVGEAIKLVKDDSGNWVETGQNKLAAKDPADVSASRVADLTTWYQNTTGTALLVSVIHSDSGAGVQLVNTLQISENQTANVADRQKAVAHDTQSVQTTVQGVVPPGSYYRAGSAGTLEYWIEQELGHGV